ncbi:MAG: hypothetical protein A2W99_14435 [Bacteroidetes bacterium GWF2_33_16]|nr:MAG: hypothetical protein A2X00_08645 [Bacteroidetes bacterium GWE2_32_14]OFY04872.1 MAG: hypothetical protein A2W99_14435 [Bacteroidetes bacterium GWF2_33_16]
MIRFAQEEDLNQIVNIYNQAIINGTTADTIPYKVSDKLNWFKEHSTEFYPIYIKEEYGKIRGWCSISHYRTGRLAVARTAEISYYVDYSYHRQGIGSDLISYALQDCIRIEKKTLIAIILENNIPSINLLSKFGFGQWGFMPDVAEFGKKTLGHLFLGKKIDYERIIQVQ